MRQRIQITGFFSAMVFLAIVIRLMHLQIFEGSSYAKTAFNEHYRLIEKKPRRGSVWDRQNRLLAVSLACDSLYADPKEIKNHIDVANLLSSVLGGSFQQYSSLLNQKNRRFAWLYRGIAPAQSKLLHQWKIPGLFFRKETTRFYPGGMYSGPVTGIANVDGEGLEGIEIGMESSLAGRKGLEILAQDALARPYLPEDIVVRESEPGKDVFLTLDFAIQHFACEALKEVINKENARWAAAVVLDAETGDILALGSEPSYDPNYYLETSPDERRNHCITELVEPGSTFKAITFADVLNQGLCDPSEIINCQGGRLAIGHDVFNDWKKFNKISAREVLVFSSNVGTILLGKRVGGASISTMARNLGLCRTAELPLPGAQMGYIRSNKTWSPTATASLSIGYGVATTALQLATAYNAFANDGLYIAPRLLKTESISQKVRVIDSEPAHLLRSILSEVVSRGTGHLGQPKFYTAGGKTGTARRYDPIKGAYIEGQIICVFAGFAPATHPRIAMCVIIDDPKESIWASQVAAPVFGALADRILIYLSVPSDKEALHNPAQEHI